jgi:hypothetical protein
VRTVDSLVAIGDDGAARLLERQPDLLLGVDPNTRPGRLVERRDADIDEGLLRLQEVATDEAGLPLDTLCEVLLSARAERPDDDIAVLALRAR